MVKRIVLGVALVVGFFLMPRHALAVPCTQTLIFTTGEVLTAAVLNANPANEVNCVNNIDNTNIGANGIYASQIIPTTAGQATFGGTIGYTFSPGNTAAIPLTITNAASPSVDYFDIVSNASAKLFTVDNGGNANVGVTALGTTGAGSQITPSGAVFGGNVKSTNGVFQNGGGGTAIQLCTNACSALVSAAGAYQGTHNACSSGSGLPCAIVATCTLSGGACTITQAVPSGSVCSVSAVFESGFLMQSVDSSVASTTLTAHIGYSGGTNGGINITCD